MRRFLVGTLKAQGQPDQQVSYYETTHGPVVGYATVAGKRVAISVQRSTRGRELLSTRAFYDLNTGRVTSAKDFLSTMNGVEFSFNWFYADDRDIALFSSGRLPVRAAGTDPALPTVGTGEYDWRGFIPFAAHAQGINPPSGTILNWNNRPAPNVGAADSNFAYGSVHRNDLLRAAVAGRKKHTLATLTSAMNKAATQDLRAVRVWPVIRAVLQTGPGAERARRGCSQSRRQLAAAGSSRLDRELDGKVDHAGAAVLDAAWPRSPTRSCRRCSGRSSTARRTARPERRCRAGRLGVHLRLVRLRRQGPSDAARARRSRPVLAPLLRSRRARVLPRGALGCARRRRRASSRRRRARRRLRGEPTRRPSASASRPGVLPDTMRWTNRPTFQQLMSFSSHRPRVATLAA